jgi:hypothetical protein
MPVLRFRAMESYKDIKTCDADVFVLPNQAYAGDGVHLRYALFRMIADGFHRVMASFSPVVKKDYWEFHREWFSGEPHWIQSTSPMVRHNTNSLFISVWDQSTKRGNGTVRSGTSSHMIRTVTAVTLFN